VQSKTTTKAIKAIQPLEITKLAIMMLGKTEDFTFIRTGAAALVDLGIDNPVEAWTQGNYSKAASLIREELGLPKLNQEYIRIANSLQSIGLAHKLVSTLADTLIQVATIKVFFKGL
jgi:hypothetical protein